MGPTLTLSQVLVTVAILVPGFFADPASTFSPPTPPPPFIEAHNLAAMRESILNQAESGRLDVIDDEANGDSTSNLYNDLDLQMGTSEEDYNEILDPLKSGNMMTPLTVEQTIANTNSQKNRRVKRFLFGVHRAHHHHGYGHHHHGYHHRTSYAPRPHYGHHHHHYGYGYRPHF